MRQHALIISILCLASSGLAHAGQSPWEEQAARFPFNSAVIHYTVEGGEQGKETLYIRERGMEQAHIWKTTGKSLFRATTTDKIMITTKEMITEVDMTSKTGESYINPQKMMIQEYNSLTPAEKEIVKKNSIEMGNSMLGGLANSGLMKFKKNADTILGYKCDIISGLGTQVWQLSGTGIPLKSEMSLIGATTTTATKVETGAAVPASVFEIPAGVKVVHNKDKDEENRRMAKSMIDMLKDPQTAKNIEEGRKQAAQKSAESPSGGENGENGEITDQRRKEANEAIQKGVDAIKGIFGGGK